MLLGSGPALNAIHLIHEQTRPTAKIDAEPCFILDF